MRERNSQILHIGIITCSQSGCPGTASGRLGRWTWFQRSEESPWHCPKQPRKQPGTTSIFAVRKKIFCFPGETAMTVKADPEELEALLHDPRFELARYVGRFGWVSMTFGDTADLAELRELILTSYLLIAPKTLGRQALAEHQDKTSRETSG